MKIDYETVEAEAESFEDAVSRIRDFPNRFRNCVVTSIKDGDGKIWTPKIDPENALSLDEAMSKLRKENQE